MHAHATTYTYKLNVAYLSIPNGFSKSLAPCTTSTICHLKMSLRNLRLNGDLSPRSLNEFFYVDRMIKFSPRGYVATDERQKISNM